MMFPSPYSTMGADSLRKNDENNKNDEPTSFRMKESALSPVVLLRRKLYIICGKYWITDVTVATIPKNEANACAVDDVILSHTRTHTQSNKEKKRKTNSFQEKKKSDKSKQSVNQEKSPKIIFKRC